MSKLEIKDDLWDVIRRLLPPEPDRPKGGRPRVPDRAAINGIVFVLRTGIPWEHLPLRLGYGSGMTCWRRLRDWQQSGVWDRLHKELLRRLRSYDQIDMSRVSVDAASVPSPPGGEETGPNPTDRGKLGCKRHVAVDARGTPLSFLISGANTHDSKCFEAVVNALPAVGGLRGRPRRWPDKVHADKGYDYEHCRHALRHRGIVQRIARRGVESSQRLGKHRWVVERTFAWLNRFKRLRIRYERRPEIYLAFGLLACSLICWRAIERFC
ncbi:IS5 family transposase [Tahibacter amnicola]|uniref:IS5 family transposase n=1 Tax=Tahibacter amnicola TaxID=2976241 RepID=A0ABY6BEJ8_9GAMM|nr:IS5 family transposase [Tahibacter amnicola]MCU7370306.1 IS5 family transposase [Paucibacter sp. O1-1]MDA3825291.1 IS5 family transposase [Paucibacter sp. O1-1]UXI67535.1 IS5 family transposase [Tahibacter amnicola]UXI67768.1 IS5 family transposase [Tahibacter amnicola]UXI67951.1 IS5 family transposase [Tahibacter amnicola]